MNTLDATIRQILVELQASDVPRECGLWVLAALLQARRVDTVGHAPEGRLGIAFNSGSVAS